EDPAGYDWEGGSVPAEPEPLALPAAVGAPSSTYDPQRAPEEPRRRPALPAWAIVAIVLLQSAARVASVALVIGGIERITSRGPEAPTAAPSTEAATPSAAPTTSSPERRPGTATDSAGPEEEDGTGGEHQPAARSR